MRLKKNMKLGNKTYLILFFYFIFTNTANVEEKITTSPLINVEQIKPSFEELDEDVDNILSCFLFLKIKS